MGAQDRVLVFQESYFKTMALVGLGSTSKDIVCGKRTHPLAELHRKATYPFGTDYWDDMKGRSCSVGKDAFRDPCVTLQRLEVPYKNASIVELRQGAYDPQSQFKSEMASTYRGTKAPKQARCPPFETNVHLGDYPRMMETQYQANSKPGQKIPPFFDGVSKWPKYPPFDPINGRRTLKDSRGTHFPLSNANFSLEYDEGIRDPVLGVYRPRPAHNKPTAAEIVALANADTPVLRSCGALRPHF